MPDPIHDYEQVSVYALDDAQREELLHTHAECTMKGRCVVHEDTETNLDSPLRVVLEVVPEKWITHDGVKMFLDAASKLPAASKSAPKCSDTARLERELRRRGLAQEKG